mmetsp:Transcript_25049/g.48739  ORF Transcript_25049/g.48739 Transcript_25049/m.48739 type:complete len:250 (+) Transcript_25049:51-800(+)
MAGLNLAILDVVDQAMEEQREEENISSQNFVKVEPKQMRLLRKMSAVGLDPTDIDPYEPKAKIGQEALHPQALLVLGACGAFLLWSPDAGGIYCVFLPLILCTVWLLALLPREFAQRAEEAKQELDDPVSIISSATRSRRHGHFHHHHLDAGASPGSTRSRKQSTHHHHSTKRRQSTRTPGEGHKERLRHLGSDNLEQSSPNPSSDRLDRDSRHPSSGSLDQHARHRSSDKLEESSSMALDQNSMLQQL